MKQTEHGTSPAEAPLICRVVLNNYDIQERAQQERRALLGGLESQIKELLRRSYVMGVTDACCALLRLPAADLEAHRAILAADQHAENPGSSQRGATPN
jgi:hypothetical protein